MKNHKSYLSTIVDYLRAKVNNFVLRICRLLLILMQKMLTGRLRGTAMKRLASTG